MQPVERALWDRLVAAGVVAGEPPSNLDEMPWFISMMLGIAAWFSSWFLMVFIGAMVSDAFDNAAGLLVAGLICCGVAIFLLRGARPNAFRGHFAVPFGLVGQGLVVYGIVDSMGNETLATIGVVSLVVCGAMAALVAQTQHRFLSSL